MVAGTMANPIPPLMPLPGSGQNPATLPGNPGGRANPATPATDTTWQIINSAAHAHNIPGWVLLGIYGAESSFGKGGTNWFGLVAVPRSTDGPNGGPTFHGDANIAAATVANLLHNNGNNLEQALRAYSGNSYGVAHVLTLSRQAPTHVNQTESNLQKIAAGPVGDAAQSALDALSVPAKFFALITSLEFWLRLGEGIAGLILIAMGLKSLTGIAIPTPVGRV